VATSGRIGGFEGKKSGTAVRRKIQMLKAEGIEFEGESIRNFKKILFRF